MLHVHPLQRCTCTRAECLAYGFLDLFLGDLPWKFDPASAKAYARRCAEEAAQAMEMRTDVARDAEGYDVEVYKRFAKTCAT